MPERAERAAAADEERAEELHVVEAQRLDRRAERGQGEVERVEEDRDEHAHPDRSDGRQLVRDGREMRRREADRGEPQVGEDVPDRAHELQRAGDDAERPVQRHDEDEPDDRRRDGRGHGAGGRWSAAQPATPKRPPSASRVPSLSNSVRVLAEARRLPGPEPEPEDDVRRADRDGEQQQRLERVG